MSRLSSSRRQVHAELAPPRKGGGGYTNFSGVILHRETVRRGGSPEEYRAVIAQRIQS